MKNYSYKKGFTLVEAMILMLGITIIIAATLPVITKMHSAIPKKLPHGKYVCTLETTAGANYGKYKEILYKDNTVVSEKILETSSCTFVPPQKAAYFLVQIVGGGSGGGYAGTPAGLGSDAEASSINVANPTLPTWLSKDDYEAKAGKLTITLAGASGGKGGDYKYVSGGEVKNLGGIGETFAEQTDKSIAIKLAKFTAPSGSSCNGANGHNYDQESDTDPATDGTVGRVPYVTYGFADNTGGELPADKVANDLTGGKAATAASAGTGELSTNTTYDSTKVGTCVAVGWAPQAFATTESYSKQKWKYGKGGAPGAYDATFIASIKNNVIITVGNGGAAGTLATPKGGDGGSTYFGPMSAPILAATGTTDSGGAGDNETDWIKSGTTGDILEYSSSTYYKYGEAGILSSYAAISDVLGLTKRLGNQNYGAGGQGGGTYASCVAGTNTYKFAGSANTNGGADYTTSTTEDPCAKLTPLAIIPASAGGPGAVIITW